MKRTPKEEGVWLQRTGLIIGLIFISIGLLGFVPLFAPRQHFLGLFYVNKAQNLIHLVTGIMAIVAALGETKNIRLFFRLFGAAYAIVGIMGFFQINESLFGWLSNNAPDAWFHTIVGATLLALGVVKNPARRKAPERRTKSSAKNRPRLEHQAV